MQFLGGGGGGGVVKKKKISGAAASCYPIIIRYKRRLIRNQAAHGCAWSQIEGIVQGIELKLLN